MDLESAFELVKEVLGESLDWDDAHYEALETALDCMVVIKGICDAFGTDSNAIFERIKDEIRRCN